MGLLDREREEAAPSGGAPAARDCSTERGRRLLLGELSLSGAARFEGRKRLLRLGELPLRGAAGMGEGGG